MWSVFATGPGAGLSCYSGTVMGHTRLWDFVITCSWLPNRADEPCFARGSTSQTPSKTSQIPISRCAMTACPCCLSSTFSDEWSDLVGRGEVSGYQMQTLNGSLKRTSVGPQRPERKREIHGR